MAQTTFTTIRKWSDDEDNPGEWPHPDEWPYPTTYVKSRIDGELADKIRARFGVDGDVHMTEAAISGGWSEYTQETDYEFTVECGGRSQEFGTEFSSRYGYEANGLKQLLEWIDSGDPDVAALNVAHRLRGAAMGQWDRSLYAKASESVKSVWEKITGRYSLPEQPD